MANQASPAAIRALQAELEQCSARYDSLVRRAGFGTYRCSITGRIVEANSTLAVMLGYDDPAQLLSLDLVRALYLDADERERLFASTDTAVGQGWVDARWKRHDGSPLNVRIS